MNNKRPILIVQGGQWGSEAKGAITGYLTQKAEYEVRYCVRTGATNAGHTVYFKRTKVMRDTENFEYNGVESVAVKLQQLPCGFVNPDTILIIGAGALIDLDILARETELLSNLTGTDIRKRLYIDPRAGVHYPIHADRSRDSGRHHRIGATGKGCSEALIDRIRGRGSNDLMLFGQTKDSHDYNLADTEMMLNSAYDRGDRILLEGTQGQLLDLYLGPYPYTTHKQTGPAQWMLEAGLSPSLQTEIVGVYRTCPIRVAGNSGPMQQETSWPRLARDINAKRELRKLPPIVQEESILAYESALADAVFEDGAPDIPAGEKALQMHQWSPGNRDRYAAALSELPTMAWKSLSDDTRADLAKLFEVTTVTKKLRRIASITKEETQVSARQMRPSRIALTFMNYLTPEHWYEMPSEVSIGDNHILKTVESWTGAKIRLITYGPESSHIMPVTRNLAHYDYCRL